MVDIVQKQAVALTQEVGLGDAKMQLRALLIRLGPPSAFAQWQLWAQQAEMYASVCRGCLSSLERGKVLRSCEQLLPLTLAESLLVSAHCPTYLHMVLRPPVCMHCRGSDTFQLGMRGHVVALPNPSTEQMARCMPHIMQVLTCALFTSL